MKNDLPERGEVIASSSQHSREIAHVPIHEQVQRNIEERDRITTERQQVQQALSQINIRRRQAQSELIGRRLPTDTAVVESNKIEMSCRKEKTRLTARLKELEQRSRELASSRTRLLTQERQQAVPSEGKGLAAKLDAVMAESRDTLGRIEQLLQKILEALGGN